MKTKLLFAAGALLLAAAISAFVYVNNESTPMDELFNANVEALANDETLNPKDYVTCFHSITEYDGTPGIYLTVRRCIDCKEIDALSASNSQTCML